MVHNQLPPDAVMMQLIFGKMIACALGGIARTGAPDHMGADPRPVTEIAAAAGVNADALHRVLRMLSVVGVAIEAPGPSYGLTPVGMLLQSNAPNSLRNMCIMFTDPWIMGAYGEMAHCIQTGGDGVTEAFGKHAFDYLADHPGQRDNFARAMSDFTGVALPAVLGAYDFSRFRRMADIGGSQGVLLAGIMGKNTGMHGVLFDLPEVIAGAPAIGYFAGCEGRISYESGSFFETVPGGCDAYIMKHIIHDWDDERCTRILSLMRDGLARYAGEHGRVFLVEMVIPETPEPAPAKFLDIEMLVCTVGGRERTETQFAALFAKASLELVGIVPTESPMCVIEARVA